MNTYLDRYTPGKKLIKNRVDHFVFKIIKYKKNARNTDNLTVTFLNVNIHIDNECLIV